MGKANNVVVIPTSLENGFFKYWFEFLRPFHKLTDKEIEVMACLVKHRYLLSKSIINNELLDQISMNEDTKRKVREECGLSQTYFQILMSKLKKRNMIVNGIINPKFIPRIEEGSDNFQLLLSFNLDGQKNNK